MSLNHLKNFRPVLTLLAFSVPFLVHGECDYKGKWVNMHKAAAETVVKQTGKAAKADDFQTVGHFKYKGYVPTSDAIIDADQAISDVGLSLENLKQMADLLEESANLITFQKLAKAENQPASEDYFLESVPLLLSYTSDLNQNLSSSGISPLSLTEVANFLVTENGKNTFCPNGKFYSNVDGATDLLLKNLRPKAQQNNICSVESHGGDNAQLENLQGQIVKTTVKIEKPKNNFLTDLYNKSKNKAKTKKVDGNGEYQKL